MTDQEIFAKTKKIIHENMIKNKNDGGDGFHYTKPSPGRYPYQFFWDTCFHVFILSALGEHDMAKEHLLSLYAKQKDDGFVGHMIYWDRVKPGRITDIFQSKPSLRNLFHSHTSCLIQPPLSAQAVARIVHTSGDLSFMKKMLPKLKKHFDWLAQNRDFHGDKLLTIISPFESGMDWKPTYDIVLNLPEKKADWRLFMKVIGVDLKNYCYGYNLTKIAKKSNFLIKDAGFNTIYAQNLHALAELCSLAKDPNGERYRELANNVSHQMLTTMYDEKDAAFYDVFGKDNKKIKILTPTVFYPVVLNTMPEEIVEQVINRHFFNSEEFDTPYPIPSVSKNHPSFNPKESMYIWRGPTWIVNNWFMHQFLMEKGYRKESKKMIETIKKLIEKSGFREYYNPFTGEGYGAKDFTWAGLIVDMINMEKSKWIIK